MKRLLTVIMAGVLFGGVLATSAEAGDRGRGRRGREVRYYRDGGHYRGYARPRNVVVVRNYYRPYYRPVPYAYRYHRGGYLPPGWRTRVVPVPVYLEPQFVAVPHGYHRGFIDGHAVVYNSRGFILDISAVF